MNMRDIWEIMKRPNFLIMVIEEGEDYHCECLNIMNRRQFPNPRERVTRGPQKPMKYTGSEKKLLMAYYS